MTRRERFVNNASTTLNGAINNSVTSITVTAGVVFPAEGDYRLIIDTEVVLVTARATNVLTVVRGVDGTAAASHSNADSISALVTAGALSQYFDDFTAGASDRRPSKLLDINNVTLTTADFSWINQGASSVTNDAWGGITIKSPDTTNQFRLRLKTAPSTPYTITANFQVGPGFAWSTSGTIFGLVLRESSTGKFVLNFCETFDTAAFAKVDSSSGPTALSGNQVDFDTTEVWQQIVDDGTNIKTRVSSDGINFFEVKSEGRTVFLAGGPNQVGWCIHSRGEANKLLHLRAWFEE